MGALARKTIVVSEPARVDLRLRELGLSISILIEAMKSGLSSAALCHAYHPPNFPGLTLWAEADPVAARRPRSKGLAIRQLPQSANGGAW